MKLALSILGLIAAALVAFLGFRSPAPAGQLQKAAEARQKALSDPFGQFDQ